MSHPSLDLPFEHPSIFYKQQLSFCGAVTVPECHRWGEEPWLHLMGGTWCGRGEQMLLEMPLRSWGSRNPHQHSAHVPESGQL